jgi:hypothetical protein
MRALCWHGINDVRVDTVPDPEIQEPTDVIIKITATTSTIWQWNPALNRKSNGSKYEEDGLTLEKD